MGYFFQIFCIITFISCKCDKQQLPQVIMRAFDRKQLARLMNDCLQQRDNERLLDTVPTLCALTARTKHQDVLQYIFNSMVPMHLLKIIGTNPGAPNDQFLSYTLITIYNLTDDPEKVDSFIQNGVIEAIAMQEWWQDQYKDEAITQNGLATLVNVCSKTSRKLLPQREKAIANMVKVCYQIHPKLKPLIQKLEVALKKAQQASGSKPKKQRNARNKKGRNARNKQQQNGNIPQGAYDPQSGSYHGQQNAQRPPNYQEQRSQYGGNNQQRQQQGGPIDSGFVERPYHDENNNQNQYASQNNFNQNNNAPQNNNFGNNANPYPSQNNFNQNPYPSQNNFNQQGNDNNNANPYQSQNNFGNQGNNQNPYQSQNNFNNQPNNNQNPYASQNNFNQNMGGGNQMQMQNNLNPNVQQNNMYGNDKWEDTDSDDHGQGHGDDSSSEDEWEKEKKRKIMGSSQVALNQGQNNQYDGSQMNMQQNNQYGSQVNMNQNQQNP